MKLNYFYCTGSERVQALYFVVRIEFMLYIIMSLC